MDRPDETELTALVQAIPEGWSRVQLAGQPWGVTRSTRAGGKVVAVTAERLSGAEQLSANIWLTSQGAELRPCEVPEERVMQFLLAAAAAYSAGTKTTHCSVTANDVAASDVRRGEIVSHEYNKTPEALERLTENQFRVTQKAGTEPAFRNEYWDHHEAGIYVDVVSGQPLFSSTDKFDSGTGWPSFTKPIATDAVRTQTDRSLWMTRVEVRSAAADSHLGHIFDDGPAEAGGQRYCMNSASLRFVPVDELETQGYGEYRSLFATTDTKEHTS